MSDAADLYMTSNGDAVVALTTYKKEQDKTAQTNQPANNSKSGSSFPEEELAIFKSMWDSVSSDLPDQALPDPQTMTAEDWNKAQRAKSGLALERVLSAGRTLRDNVSQFTDNLIELPADAIKESLKLGRGVSRVVKQSKTALANDLRRLGWDISEGAEDVVDFLADVPMEATVKSTEYLMESMGFVDFQLDEKRLGADIGSSYKNKVAFLANVSNQVADEMEAVNLVIKGERAVLFSKIGGSIKNAASEVGAGIKNVAKNITESEEFDPSDIGYNPAQNTGLAAPAFDPAMAQQIIKPIVEAVTQSITTSLTPEIKAPPSMTREQSASNAAQYSENIGQPIDGLTPKEQDEVRRYPLKEVLERQKDAREHRDDLTTTDFRPENPIDFDNTKKINRWMELHNKNIENKLTAKEKKEFKRLVKYLDTRGLLPEG